MLEQIKANKVKFCCVKNKESLFDSVVHTKIYFWNVEKCLLLIFYK